MPDTPDVPAAAPRTTDRAPRLQVAIIGSGPAGYYTAEGLLDRLGAGVAIDIIDRLPTPFGLIRAGVAPDHQSIKAVIRRYEATHSAGDVHFIGNLMVGDGVSVAELLGLYDAVVLATGAPSDRPLGIPGDQLPGVFGAASFVGWYNSHPDFSGLGMALHQGAVAVIGNGNVALDVARVLAKTSTEMAGSDLARHAAEPIHAAAVSDIHIIGRRGPYQASFTPKELGELGQLAEAVPLVDPAALPDPAEDASLEPAQRKVVNHLRGFAGNDPASRPRRIHFHFCQRPVAVLGAHAVTGLRLEKTRLEADRAVPTGQFTELACGLVVTAIGYRTQPLAGVPFDDQAGHFRNSEGWIADRLYCVGWAKRGPSGTIGTNRPDAFGVAERIVAAVTPAGRPGRSGLHELVRSRNLWAVDYDGWKRIEAAEIANAPAGAPRSKFPSAEAMLAIAGRAL